MNQEPILHLNKQTFKLLYGTDGINQKLTGRSRNREPKILCIIFFLGFLVGIGFLAIVELILFPVWWIVKAWLF